jgi:hypothetical protein
LNFSSAIGGIIFALAFELFGMPLQLDELVLELLELDQAGLAPVIAGAGLIPILSKSDSLGIPKSAAK